MLIAFEARDRQPVELEPLHELLWAEQAAHDAYATVISSREEEDADLDDLRCLARASDDIALRVLALRHRRNAEALRAEVRSLGGRPRPSRNRRGFRQGDHDSTLAFLDDVELACARAARRVMEGPVSRVIGDEILGGALDHLEVLSAMVEDPAPLRAVC